MHRKSFYPNNLPRFRRISIFFGLLFFFFTANGNFAATLERYREKVSEAKYATLELLYPDAENMTFQEYVEFERKSLAAIRRSLPAGERVEWKGTTIETNNQWLIEKLDELDKEAAESPRRAVILTEIYERLDAIEHQVEELESPSKAVARTKDEDKRKLSEILRRAEFQKPDEKGESFFQKAVRKIREWLAEFFPRPQFPENFGSGFQSLYYLLQILLYIAVVGVIGFIVYRFAPLFFDRFKVREKKAKKDRVILGERLAADETARSLFAQAEQLAREGDLRGAIRKGYIALLCEMSDRKTINLARHKTNYDYLRDVRGKRELHRSFNNLTSDFERHWYGFETADDEDWREFRDKYQETVKTI